MDRARNETVDDEARIVEGTYLYRRIGYGDRLMTLADNGRITVGSAGCERSWGLRQTTEGERLTIYAENGVPTCHLARRSDGVFVGRWLEFERMPIELVPTFAGHASDVQSDWSVSFYVGIPTLNRHDLLHDCIESILRGSALPRTIFVVDNSDGPATSGHQLWGGHPSKRVRVIRSPTNLGVARSWNLLHKLCQPAPLVIINDDIEVGSNLFEKMLAVNESFVSGNRHQAFCAFLLRNEAWRRVGEFDENFYPAYHEDNDYARRLFLAGLSIHSPDSDGYRDNGPSATIAKFSPAESAVFYNSFEAGKRYYISKWGGLPQSERFDVPFDGDARSHDDR